MMTYSESAPLLQLWRAIADKRTIDDVLRWFVDTVIQRFGVQIAQLWTYQPGHADGPLIELRVSADQDITFPWNVLNSKLVAAMVEEVIEQQHDLALQPMHTVFPRHMVALLQRYGINYCAAYGVRDDLYFSLQDHDRAAEAASIPQKIALLIFARSPLQKPLAEIYALLQQTLMMAVRLRLLQTQPLVATPARHSPTPVLMGLIPRRTAEAASNPLALAITIGDKNARNLYAAIDDRKTVSELATITRLSADEIYQALQVLLAQQRIQLYEHGTHGLPIDARAFIDQGRRALHP